MVVVLALIVATGCYAPDRDLAPQGNRVDSLGISVWTIPGDDLLAPIRVERVAGFAMPDTGWAVWPDGIAVNPVEKTITVLDESTPRVLMFDFDGQFRGQIGRKGQGPGEYDEPTALDVAANGDLLVMDPGIGVVHRWSGQADYLGRDPFSVSYWGPGFASTPHGLAYTTAGGVDSGTMTEALVLTTPSSVDTLSKVKSSWRPIDMPCGTVPVPEVFSRSSVWSAASGLLAYAAVPRYDVVLRDADTTLAVFRRSIAPREMTASDAESSVPEGSLRFLVEHCGMTAAGVVREAGFVSEVSPLVFLAIDPASRVWAARGAASTIDAIDVLDPSRGFIGSIESSAFPAAFLDDSRYVTIRETEWGSVLEIWRFIDSG